MATISLRASPAVAAAQRQASARPALPVRRCLAVRAQAAKPEAVVEQAIQVGKVTALSAVAASWMAAGSASAATELMQVAASDNRLGTITLLALPALGWVGFNMLQPALAQLDAMNARKRGIAAVVGLGAASLLAAGGADAATELAQVAASDNRFGTITLLALPALGWVAFNMLQPGLAQLDAMNAKKRSVGGAIGLGAAASLLMAEQADAATELMQVAASDNRFGTIALLALPALGWVAFNMLQPALAQLEAMNSKAPAAPKKKRSVGAAIGLGGAATLLMAEQADAATELMQVAASDNRFGIIALLALPALGWVAFNMLQPALAQLDAMNSKAPAAPKKSKGKK